MELGKYKERYRMLFNNVNLKLGQNQTFDVKTLSEILGHSDVKTTLNKYVHSSMERKVKQMDLLKFNIAI